MAFFFFVGALLRADRKKKKMRNWKKKEKMEKKRKNKKKMKIGWKFGREKGKLGKENGPSQKTDEYVPKIKKKLK